MSHAGRQVISRSELKLDWAPSAESFHRFLGWLDAGGGTPGERYLEMRRRLVDYFERKRCAGADDLADETLNRVARRLEEEGAIAATAPAQYCYIVARYVFFEYLRRGDRNTIFCNETPSPDMASPIRQSADERGVEPEEDARRLTCLAQCLEKLPEADRSLILDYYSGERRLKIAHRRELAVRFGLTPNALTIRACRIRGKLEQCVSACAQKE